MAIKLSMNPKGDCAQWLKLYLALLFGATVDLSSIMRDEILKLTS
ncbi:hypothetical protein VroAM7_25390 [Vibrio rotiferianus]|uniref:Uncharacterized protein n=1 Tax=Vibrio rotiferianus TaxID=190895 RepID=A0A510IBU4_9VIBR|nr:hypothetical protein VroAM7_25390 [Vibrio rotiferianus]